MRRSIRSGVPMLLVAVLALAVSVARPGEAVTPNGGEVLAALAVDSERAAVSVFQLDVIAVSKTLSIGSSVDGVTAVASQPAAGSSIQFDRDLPRRSERYDVLKEPQAEGTAGLTQRADYRTRPSAFK